MPYSYSTTPLYVAEGDTLQFRYKAPAFWDYTETVTIQIGGLVTYWYITTIPEDFQPNPFPFQDVIDAPLNTIYVYGDGTRPGEQIITVSGLTPTTMAPVSLSANIIGGVNVYSLRINTGSGFGAWIQPTTSTTVENGHQIQVRAVSANSSLKPVEITLGIGLGYETWTIVTVGIPSNSPTPFPTFNNLTAQPINIPTYSNVIRVQGLTGPASISLDNGGQYAISNTNNTTTNSDGFDVLSGATFTSNIGTVTNGQYIQLKLQSSTSQFTVAQTSLSIGDTSAGSTWQVTTGQSSSTTPNTFSFPDITGAIENLSISSAARPLGGITGLGTGIEVPVTLISTTSSEVKIKINNASIGFLPTTVKNGDLITLYAKSSANFSTTVETQIQVGNLVIPTWQVTTSSGPDTTAVFTPPSNLSNRVPDSYVSSSVVTITDINRPITISATNGALISIDYDTPVAGPRTFNPAVNSTFFLILQAASTLLTPRSTTVTVGTGTTNNPFTWSVTTYATVPPPSANLGKWYSKKTDKFDGYPIGTVLPIMKKSVGDYGNLTGNLDSRYPGFIECNGASYNASQYPALWSVIGNTYGGNGSYNSVTKIYSGTFNVPDYRNRRLTGAGFVDGTNLSSAFLPISTPGKGIFDVGAEGGYWYFDKVDSASSVPYEQVIGSGTTGIESQFFSLGTVKITSTQNVTDEITFTVTGSVTAQVGPLLSVLTTIPLHTHTFISAVVQDTAGDPLIPWDARALFGSPSTMPSSGTPNDLDNEAVYGGGNNNLMSNVANDSIKYWKEFISNLLPNFMGEVGLYNNTSIDTFAASLPQPNAFGNTGPAGLNTINIDFLTLWPSPASATDAPTGDGRFLTLTTAVNGGREVTAVIDTQSSSFRIDNYTPPNSATNPHSHFLTLSSVQNANSDFSGGNVDGPGIIGGIYGSGLGDAGASIQVTFQQTDVQMSLTEGIFSFTSSVKKPIPDVALAPQRQVPILNPFHKTKYIIKAY
jgi:hypothetical protein